MRRAALATVWLLATCGTPTASGADSSSTTAVGSPATTPATDVVLEPGNCTGPSTSSNSTKTKALGMDRITLTVPVGWLDQTSHITGEAVLLRIQAPDTYAPSNATFMLAAIPGPRPGSSAHEQATEDAGGRTAGGSHSLVSDCVVGGEKASFYGYQDSAGSDVQRLLVLHSPSSRYPFLYVVEISSRGQIGSRTQADIRAILGSWTWGSPVYNPTT